MYSVREFAQKVGVSRQYVWVLINKGRLTAERIGSYYAIPESELAKFIKPKDLNAPDTIFNNLNEKEIRNEL